MTCDGFGGYEDHPNTTSVCDHTGCFRPKAPNAGYCEFHLRFIRSSQPVVTGKSTHTFDYKHRFAATVFIDLDGTIVEHRDPMTWYDPLEILPGVHETFTKWWNAGVKIIITTGRPASNRDRLEEELSRLGIFYHQLIMDCGSGIRYLINDVKPYDPHHATAISLNVSRNEGLNRLGITIK